MVTRDLKESRAMAFQIFCKIYVSEIDFQHFATRQLEFLCPFHKHRWVAMASRPPLYRSFPKEICTQKNRFCPTQNNMCQQKHVQLHAALELFQSKQTISYVSDQHLLLEFLFEVGQIQ